MPPSGYSYGQADTVAQFLRSCAAALLTEASEELTSPVDRLDREISDIIRYRAKMRKVDDATDAVLALTLKFYQSMRTHRPANPKAFEAALPKVLEEIVDEILKVHIPKEIASDLSAAE